MHIDRPFTLPAGTVLKNRLLKSAMSEALGTVDNRPTIELVTLYGRWAEGGTGLLVTGNVMVDRRALGEPKNVALEDERDMPLFRAWAEAATRKGTAVFMQLNHPGKQVPKSLNRESVAPSAVPFAPALAPFFPVPRALTEAEIEDIIARFGTSARLAKEAGFTGVQIHGAHGYLVSQFLSPLQNVRDDQWGGSIENRMRFVLGVYDAIRREVGPSFPISIKLNSADFQKGGFTDEESRLVVRTLAARGIDLVELSGGTYEAPVMAKGESLRESTKAREAYFLDFASTLRSTCDVPLAVTGGFRSREGIESALASGALDVAGLGRALALDPDFSRKLIEGHDVTSQVKPVRTGIGPIDRMAMMEVGFYGRQIRRMARGREPRPDENATLAAIALLCEQGIGTMRTRLRA